LKDGLQEVPKGDKWSRRHLFFPGNQCLHLRGISTLRQCKKAIKSNPHPDPYWTTSFWVPLHAQPCSLSLLFSTNKIFPTSAAGIYLCFHSQSRLKNPEHLKFLHVSSVHQNYMCSFSFYSHKILLFSIFFL
jgi:hypothetical protein